MYVILKKQHILAALACTVLFIGLPILCLGGGDRTAATAAANTNWGLSFQEKGKPPVGNATADFLKQYNAYYYDGGTKEKKIYLTFDAGYENGYTPAILDCLLYTSPSQRDVP